MSTLRVAVVGATGMVGREMLNVLHERAFPANEIIAMASSRSAGERVEFGDGELVVQEAKPDAFKDIDIVLMSAGSGTSEYLSPHAVEAGAVVIDNSSQWRMTQGVPLVVPEVNPDAIAGYTEKGIIANPNCSTIQMVVALAPLHAKAGLKRVVVSTYQAASGAGKKGMDELHSQVAALYSHQDFEPQVFSRQLAFNCVPHIDVFKDDGFTKEEHKMIFETRKIMNLPNLAVCATCVRVPVYNGHAESINAEFDKPISVDDAKGYLRSGEGLMVIDDPGELLFPTQKDADGTDATFVGRMRQDPSVENGLVFWCVADNLRKGAATNAVQIAEVLAREYLAKSLH